MPTITTTTTSTTTVITTTTAVTMNAAPIATTVYAKKRGSAPVEDERKTDATVIYLDVPIIPDTPIHVGQKIRIATLVSCDVLFPSEEASPPRYYITEDVEIWGVVNEVRAVEEYVIEFALKNENTESKVAYAYIAVQREEGIMVKTPLLERIWRNTLARPTKGTRRVPIEDEATVFEDTTTPNFSARPALKGHRRRGV
ncbi:hypothetical protein OH77DRAFT_1422341 [Trametes cingulata]|nr:hypothetical protein OH77DRAFT_1422341 [Trametes cingulata]